MGSRLPPVREWRCRRGCGALIATALFACNGCPTPSSVPAPVASAPAEPSTAPPSAIAGPGGGPASNPGGGRTATFSCSRLPGVRFAFPVFPGWEPRHVVEREDGCDQLLSHPDTIDYESARMIRVRRGPARSPAPADVRSVHGGVERFGAAVNPRRHAYAFVFDPSRWSAGYRPPPDLWDYIAFYLPSQTITIAVDGGSLADGFDLAATADEITRSFAVSAPSGAATGDAAPIDPRALAAFRHEMATRGVDLSEYHITSVQTDEGLVVMTRHRNRPPTLLGSMPDHPDYEVLISERTFEVLRTSIAR